MSYAGQTVRLKNVKGLRDIARLLAGPGTEVHALDLVGAPGGQDTGELTDARARAGYRARLSELDSRIADGDQRAADEREVLVAHLAAAYGLGGRPRRAGDPAERARATATWRIRDAIGRVERVAPRPRPAPACLDPHRHVLRLRAGRAPGLGPVGLPHIVRRFPTPNR